ncbi:MAG: hypothetical protein HFE94_05525 [Acutalibacter sp.]|nr:hypothetical protein [Acutalibacter sp.]
MTKQEALKGLSLTLHDIGFALDEAESYMRLALEGDSTGAQRMLMLNQKRRKTLDEIHFHEKQLDRLDYLRYEIQKKKSNKEA